VVRGSAWASGDEDGGAGGVGQVTEINDETVYVQWAHAILSDFFSPPPPAPPSPFPPPEAVAMDQRRLLLGHLDALPGYQCSAQTDALAFTTCPGAPLALHLRTPCRLARPVACALCSAVRRAPCLFCRANLGFGVAAACNTRDRLTKALLIVCDLTAQLNSAIAQRAFLIAGIDARVPGCCFCLSSDGRLCTLGGDQALLAMSLRWEAV